MSLKPCQREGSCCHPVLDELCNLQLLFRMWLQLGYPVQSGLWDLQLQSQPDHPGIPAQDLALPADKCRQQALTAQCQSAVAGLVLR